MVKFLQMETSLLQQLKQLIKLFFQHITIPLNIVSLIQTDLQQHLTTTQLQIKGCSYLQLTQVHIMHINATALLFTIQITAHIKLFSQL
jgi:hypothetical protein